MELSNIKENIFYHGGLEEIKYPLDNKTTSLSTDFGNGFYLTEIRSQAEKWALNKAEKIRSKGWGNPKSIVSMYLLDKEKVLTNFKSKYFSGESEEWLDFIISCRNKQEHNYDYVEGPMGDDQIYNFVRDLINGEMSKEEFWKKASFGHKTYQIMIRHDTLSCLKFITSYEVGEL